MTKLNKKSQLYFFAAVILIGLVFLIVSSQPSFSSRNNKNLKNLFDNYKYEAEIIIDNALYEDKNISYELRNYTEQFIAYAKNKDMDIGILYLYSYQNYTYIVNYLNQEVLVNPIAVPIQKKGEIKTSVNTTQIVYSNNTYTYKFTQDQIKFKALFVEGG